MATQGFNHWVCVGCGYIYEGSTPPDECPVCKAPNGHSTPGNLCQQLHPLNLPRSTGKNQLRKKV